MRAFTRRQKILLAIFMTSFIFFSCCSSIALWSFTELNQAMTTDPAKAQMIGQEIATYTLPQGFETAFGMQLFGTDVVIITEDLTVPNAMTIALMKIPDTRGMDEADLERQLLQSVQRQFNWQNLNLNFDRVETREINGQMVDLTYRKGENGAGVPFQQMMGLFESGDGKVFVLVQGAEADWDQAAIDSLLDSVR